MLSFTDGNKKLNIRSVAVIINNNCVLIHREKSDNFWALPGGRVEFFENSDDTLIREMKEELGLNAKVIRHLWCCENFFEYDNKKYHELSNYYLTEFVDNIDVQHNMKMVSVDTETELEFKWVSLDTIKDIILYPIFLKDRLLNLPDKLEFIKVNELK